MSSNFDVPHAVLPTPLDHTVYNFSSGSGTPSYHVILPRSSASNRSLMLELAGRCVGFSEPGYHAYTVNVYRWDPDPAYVHRCYEPCWVTGYARVAQYHLYGPYPPATEGLPIRFRGRLWDVRSACMALIQELPEPFRPLAVHRLERFISAGHLRYAWDDTVEYVAKFYWAVCTNLTYTALDRLVAEQAGRPDQSGDGSYEHASRVVTRLDCD